jgi:hypothetical protein
MYTKLEGNAEAGQKRAGSSISITTEMQIGPGRVVIRVSTAAVHVSPPDYHAGLLPRLGSRAQRSAVASKHGSHGACLVARMGKTTADPRRRPCVGWQAAVASGRPAREVNQIDVIART